MPTKKQDKTINVFLAETISNVEVVLKELRGLRNREVARVEKKDLKEPVHVSEKWAGLAYSDVEPLLEAVVTEAKRWQEEFPNVLTEVFNQPKERHPDEPQPVAEEQPAEEEQPTPVEQQTPPEDEPKPEEQQTPPEDEPKPEEQQTPPEDEPKPEEQQTPPEEQPAPKETE